MHDDREPGADEPRRPADPTDSSVSPSGERTAPVDPWGATPAAAEASPSEPGGTAQWRAPGDQAPPPSELEAYPADAAGGSYAAADDTPTATHSVPPATEGLGGESTLCPRCGTENRAGLAFCRNCGQRLVAAGVSTTVDRPEAPEGSMACPRCGTHNRAGVTFCQNCGANLRGMGSGYVPPAAATDAGQAEPAAVAVAPRERRGAVLGPVVLLIGLAGLVTGYLLPFAYGPTSLWERAAGSGGYGVAFWGGYGDVGGALTDQAYFGLAAPLPLLWVLLVALAVAGFVRATPGPAQTVGLAIALLWSIALAVLFVVVELLGNWGGDLVGLLSVLTPAGIIFFLSSLIVLIGTLTRFGRS